MDPSRLQSYYKKAQAQLEQASPVMREENVFNQASKRYQDLKKIAEGGQKKLYHALDLTTGRVVALAFLKNRNKGKEHFIREARITSYLEHPSILPIYDFGTWDDGQPFYTMQYINGITLRQQFKRDDNDKTLKQLLEVFIKICDALEYAHDKSILHLDLKPENILLNQYGSVLVLDWGLARVTSRINSELYTIHDDELVMSTEIGLANASSVHGTAGYMAPEIIKNRFKSVDERSDIFALGIILEEMCLVKVTKAEMPISLLAIIEKAKNPQKIERYRTVNLLNNDVKAYLSGFATTAEEASIGRHFSLLIKRNQLISFIFFVAVLFSTSNLYYHLWKTKKKNRELDTAVKNYQQEKILREKALKKSAQLYLTKMDQTMITDWNYDILVQDLKEGRKLDPTIMPIPHMAGLMALAKKDIRNAHKHFRNGKYPIHYKITSNFIQYADQQGFINQKVFRDLIQYHLNMTSYWPAYFLIDQDIRSQVNNLDKHEAFDYWITRLNPGLDDLIFSFQKKKFINSIAHDKLTITGKKLYNFSPMQNLPIYSLDISNCNFHQDRYLEKMPLEELFLDSVSTSNTKVYPWKTLRALHLHNCPKIKMISWSNSNPPQLNQLSLIKTNINNIRDLSQIKSLKRLYISHGAYLEEDLELLKKSGIDIYLDDESATE